MRTHKGYLAMHELDWTGSVICFGFLAFWLFARRGGGRTAVRGSK